jgi:ferritin-like metal-binding protein YciE
MADARAARHPHKSWRLNNPRLHLFREWTRSKEDIMNQTGNATVLLWLRDAHAMESQSVQMLTSQLPSLIGFPAFHESVKAHAELSREQRNRLHARIAELGHASSLLRDGLGMALGLTAPMMIAALPDNVARSAVANYAFEHLEIGTYSALIGLAEQAGDRKTQNLAESILAQELEMAAWLEEHLAAIAAAVLPRAAAVHGVWQLPMGGMPPMGL